MEEEQRHEGKWVNQWNTDWNSTPNIAQGPVSWRPTTVQ